MVKALHREGIEVILDVVYNHTAEGNQLGPTLSFRGIDNSTYYRLVHDNPRYYMDYTGHRQHANVRHPQVLKLIMDSLRYWVQEMHVDGFRFDLAAALARELHDVDRLVGLLRHHPPGPGDLAGEADRRAVGRRRGRLPGGQLPGRCGRSGTASIATRCAATGRATTASSSDLGYRLTGSSDLYQRDGRQPYASINFITAHDGFTLHDLVSYNDKHNEANGEDNQRRRQRQPLLEHGRGRADRRSRRSSRCASARSAISWRRCCSRRACR